MKRAVNSLAESAAITYGPEGIRVNAHLLTAAARRIAAILSRASRVRLGVQDHA